LSSAQENLRQEDHEFHTSLGYIARLSQTELNEIKQNKKSPGQFK
jgi:hypothetical protein